PGVLRDWVRALMAILLKYQAIAGAGALGELLVGLSRRLRRLQAMLQDPADTRFVLVTRAAALPREETIRLERALPRLRIAAAGVQDGTAPDVVALAPSLWLVTSQVPLDVYGSPHLDARLRDLDWVSDAAVAHEAVVERFAAAPAATVVPMKLFTMFSSIDRAIEDVRGRRAALQRVLKRIA